METFNFSVPQDITVGKGSLSKLPEIAKKLGGKHALIISGPHLEKMGLVKKAADYLASVDIKADTFIPESYIPAHNIRLEIYKRIAAVQNEEDKEAAIDDLIDRFGQPPQSVINLIDISLIRVFAGYCKMTEVTERGGRVMMFFEKEPPEDRIRGIVSKFRGELLYSPGAKPHLTYISSGSKTMLISGVKTVLREYAAQKQ